MFFHQKFKLYQIHPNEDKQFLFYLYIISAAHTSNTSQTQSKTKDRHLEGSSLKKAFG